MAVAARRYSPLPTQTEKKTFNQARVGKAVFLSAMFFIFADWIRRWEAFFLYFSAFLFQTQIKICLLFRNYSLTVLRSGLSVESTQLIPEIDRTLSVVGGFFPTDCVIRDNLSIYYFAEFEEEDGHLLLKLTHTGRLAGRPIVFAVCIFWARDVPRLISAALIESLRERCTGIGFPLTEWKWNSIKQPRR